MNANNLKPCCYCLFAKDCTARAQFLAQVKKLKNGNVGAWVSSIGLNCRKYFTQFKPGDRVTFEYAEYWESVDPGPYQPVMDWVDGTVIRWKGRKLLIFLDEEISITFRGKERFLRIVSMYPMKQDSLQDIQKTKEHRTKEEIKSLIFEMSNYNNKKFCYL